MPGPRLEGRQPRSRTSRSSRWCSSARRSATRARRHGVGGGVTPVWTTGVGVARAGGERARRAHASRSSAAEPCVCLPRRRVAIREHRERGRRTRPARAAAFASLGRGVGGRPGASAAAGAGGRRRRRRDVEHDLRVQLRDSQRGRRGRVDAGQRGGQVPEHRLDHGPDPCGRVEPRLGLGELRGRPRRARAQPRHTRAQPPALVLVSANATASRRPRAASRPRRRRRAETLARDTAPRARRDVVFERRARRPERTFCSPRRRDRAARDVTAAAAASAAASVSARYVSAATRYVADAFANASDGLTPVRDSPSASAGRRRAARSPPSSRASRRSASISGQVSGARLAATTQRVPDARVSATHPGDGGGELGDSVVQRWRRRRRRAASASSRVPDARASAARRTSRGRARRARRATSDAASATTELPRAARRGEEEVNQRLGGGERRHHSRETENSASAMRASPRARAAPPRAGGASTKPSRARATRGVCGDATPWGLAPARSPRGGIVTICGHRRTRSGAFLGNACAASTGFRLPKCRGFFLFNDLLRSRIAHRPLGDATTTKRALPGRRVQLGVPSDPFEGDPLARRSPPSRRPDRSPLVATSLEARGGPIPKKEARA